MQRFALFAALFLCLSTPSFAKLHVKIAVQVSNDKDHSVENTLKEGMEARLNSTERYTISDNALIVDLAIEVNCITLENTAGYKAGIVCDSEVTYYPFKYSPLATSVENASHMAAGGLNDGTFIVDTLLNRFINGTTDSELAARKSMVREAVQLLCVNSPKECAAPKEQ